MEKVAGGIPYESVNENLAKEEVCPLGGGHDYQYTGKEKPGDIISFWPDREMMCTKCHKKIWSNF